VYVYDTSCNTRSAFLLYEPLNVYDEHTTTRRPKDQRKARCSEKGSKIIAGSSTHPDNAGWMHQVSVFHCEYFCTKHTPYSVPSCCCNATTTALYNCCLLLLMFTFDPYLYTIARCMIRTRYILPYVPRSVFLCFLEHRSAHNVLVPTWWVYESIRVVHTGQHIRQVLRRGFVSSALWDPSDRSFDGCTRELYNTWFSSMYVKNIYFKQVAIKDSTVMKFKLGITLSIYN